METKITTEQQNLSTALTERIKGLIAQQHGQISFADFMQQALYAPKLGYYSSGLAKFGVNGDFVTAPEIGPTFAKCLSNQLQQILLSLNDKNSVILEFGGGTGKLAAQLLQALNKNSLTSTSTTKTKPIPFAKYYILEVSATLRARQQQYILETCPEYFPQVEWLDQLPKQPITGIIIANEVMDAMPVTCFKKHNESWQELCVSYAKDFYYSTRNATTDLLAFLQQPEWQDYFSNLVEGYQSEVNLALPAWIKTLAKTLNRGCMLLFDYGFSRKEYYHPERTVGTLLCHRRHQTQQDPFINVGLQDITAHVDFTTVAEAALEANLEISGYTNQAAFLMNCGLIEIITTAEATNATQEKHPAVSLKSKENKTGYQLHKTKQPSYSLAQELNLLTSHAEMGEIFKVIACSRNFSLPLIGFSSFSKMQSL